MFEKLNALFSKYCDRLTLLLVFSMPLLDNKLTGLIVGWVILLSFHKLLIRRWQYEFNPQLVLLILLFAIYILGILWSSNKPAGFFAVEKKASFIAFRIIIAGCNHYFKKNQLKILLSFIVGCFVSSIICLSIAFYESISFGWNGLIFNTIDPKFASWDFGGSHFKFINLSIFLHPTYFSAYLLFAFVTCVEILRNDLIANSKMNNFLYFCIPLFMAMIYLLSSKAMIFCTVAIIIGYAVFYATNPYHRSKKISIIVFTGLVALIGFQNPRFKSVYELIANPDIVKGNEGDGTIISRIHIWKSGVEIIRSNLMFGVGPGDTNNELVKKYQVHGYKDPLRLHSNVHNQFLETFVDLGLIGFLILITILAYSFYKSVSTRNTLLCIFLCINIFNFLFESMLNVREGVVFFCFFYCFLNVADIGELHGKSVAKPVVT